MAFTGAAHPVGFGRDLLFDEEAGTTIRDTNFSSLRVYRLAGPIDYTFGGSGMGIDLDGFFTGEGASPLFAAGEGWRTIWSVTPEALEIVQDVGVVGSVFADSAIYHTVVITNTGQLPTSIGWRNLYDWQVDDPDRDDGPNNQVEDITTGVLVPATTFEFSHTPTVGDFVRVSIDPGVSTYQPLLAIGFDPGFVPTLPITVPDEYAYVDWPLSFDTAFDYTPAGLDATDDSAGLSWFGRSAGSAILLGPGESVRLTQVIFGVEPQASPPTVSEPTSLALWSIGAVGVLAYARRHRKGGRIDRDGDG